MKKFAVFGNPITHSLSPTIHQLFAQSCGEQIEYVKIECEKTAFYSQIEAFFTDPNAVGCNITAPFKEDAFRLSHPYCDEYAIKAQAVNTLYKTDHLRGYNTDGIGLVEDLLAHAGALQNATILLIGAGGAAKGVVHSLVEQRISSLHITNRTFAKASQLAYQCNHDCVQAVKSEDLVQYHYDVIINCTSASLTHALPELGTLSFHKCTLAYDMVYSTKPTAFLEHAQREGADQVADGLGMLIGQAAQAFSIWTGKQPVTSHVKDILRNQ